MTADALTLPACLRAPAGLVPGCAPLAHRGGRAGALLLHGFTGSPWELQPLADALVADGYSVAMPLLPGHGTTVAQLDQTSWQDWLAAAREALDWLAADCDRLHLCGLSMGALLALLLAPQPSPAPLRSVMLLAPALALPRSQALALRAMARLGWPRTLGKATPTLAHGAQPPAYQAIPVAATARLIELMEVVAATAPPLRVPALVLHGTADATIPFEATAARIGALLGPSGIFKPIEGAGHLLLRVEQGGEVLRRICAALAILEPYGADAPGPVPLRPADRPRRRRAATT